MKKTLYTLCCLLGFSLLASCEKDMDEYDGRDGLYFDVQYTNTSWFTNPEMWAHQIYTLVRFTTMPEGVNEAQLKLKVNAVGPMCDYDRPFNVTVVADSTNAIPDVEYKDLSTTCVVKAGETCGYVTVTVVRSDRMADENVQLQLALQPNEYFNLPYTYMDKIPGRYTELLTVYSTNMDPRIHNIFITDIMVRPKYFVPAFGEFSREKMKLMLEVYPDASYNDYENRETMPTVREKMIAEALASHLIASFKAGKPITDPDGTMMYCNGVPWTEEAMPDDVVL